MKRTLISILLLGSTLIPNTAMAGVFRSGYNCGYVIGNGGYEGNCSITRYSYVNRDVKTGNGHTIRIRSTDKRLYCPENHQPITIDGSAGCGYIYPDGAMEGFKTNGTFNFWHR